MSKAVETQTAADTTVESRTLEECLPKLLDEVLVEFEQVAVQRILKLAGEMVRAKLNQPTSAHLEIGPSGSN